MYQPTQYKLTNVRQCSGNTNIFYYMLMNNHSIIIYIKIRIKHVIFNFLL